MKIKEAEDLTGLTAKSIRLYESKGLISVARDKGNDYRNYTEENIETLKKIKLYRFIGFSIDEIGYMLEDKDKENTKLREMLEVIKDSKECIEEKDRICRKLLEDKVIYDREDLNEIIKHIDLVESEEYRLVRRIIRDSKVSSAAEVISSVVICLAPILWLFVDIARERYNNIILEVVLSLVATMCLTITISNYIKTGKRQKIEQKEANKGVGWLVVSGILCVPATMLIAFLVTLISDEVYCFDSNDFILAVPSNSFSMKILLIYSLFIGAYLVFKVIGRLTGNDWVDFGLKKETKLKVLGIFVIITAASIYFSTANMVVVTKNNIEIHSTFNPLGKSYNYKDIEEIQAGYKSNGNAYYEIVIDNKKYDLTDLYISNDKYEDTYDELSAFDNIVMKYKVKKHTSHKNQELSDLDDKYKAKFSGILDNK